MALTFLSINSNLLLLQQRINSLETTCENLSSILLGKQYLTETSSNKDYTNKFAKEFNEIKEELRKLKNRFGNHFFNSFVVNIAQNNVTTSFENSPSTKSPPTLLVNSSTQSSFLTKSEHPTISSSSFWRSYLLMCLIGLFTSFAILLYMNSRDGVDFRWSFGPQLHYQNGRPPI
ncbi:unnamed protein product [Meloidogyne enterolobii]|uniref:Uncharacterized protein n=1 Tax=Meloidogyne enterolobii TaxID=390850 RepID=A0ACB1AB99_MELEN